MSWTLLIIAGVLETCWAVGLKFTDGFTKPLPSVLTGGAIVASLYLLAIASRTIPISVAYPVWVGIGALGTVAFGITLLGEQATTGKLLFSSLLLIAIVGLKVFAR